MNSRFSPSIFTLYHLLLAFWLVLQKVSGEGQLEIKLIQYVNADGKGANGHCCDGRSFFCEANGGCDHYFKICVDSFQGADNSMTKCPVGLRLVPTSQGGQRTLNFGARIGNVANPLQLPFINWQDGISIKIQVWDEDNNQDDFVDFLKSRVLLNPASRRQDAVWTTLKINARTQMTLEVRAYCDEGWYGKNCETYCDAQASASEHFNCSHTGEKICHPGWTGHRCTTRIDHCASNPCRHNSTCRNSLTGYTCTCLQGFIGRDCEVNVDDCQNVTCHGEHSSCVDLVNGYRCDCPEDRTGDHCETSLDPCYISPCLNGGTCLPKSDEEHNMPELVSTTNYSGEENFAESNEYSNYYEDSDYLNDDKYNQTLDETANFTQTNSSMEETFRCECPKEFQGKFCEKTKDEGKTGEENIEKDDKVFIPLPKILSDEDSYLVFDGVVSDLKMNQLEKYLINWVFCRMNASDSSENASTTSIENPCLINSNSTNEEINIKSRILRCRFGNYSRENLSVFLFRVYVKQEILSKHRTEEMMQALISNKNNDSLPVQSSSAYKERTDIECIDTTDIDLKDNPDSQFQQANNDNGFNMYIIIGGVALLIVCASLVAAVIGRKAIRRKIITKEVLVPAYDNPLYNYRHGEENVQLIAEAPGASEEQPTSNQFIESNPSSTAAKASGES